MGGTHVIVLDRQVAVREMLVRVLTKGDEFQVIGQGSTGAEGREKIRLLKPNLVIMELILADGQGMDLLQQLRRTEPSTKTVVFTSSENPAFLHKAIQWRTQGVVHKQDSLVALEECVRVVTNGGRYVSPKAVDLSESSPDRTETVLSEREESLLRMLAEGSSSKQAAARLSLSVKTVEHYRLILMQKLKLRDITALTRYAIRHGLVTVEA